jgi:uncharacterized protein YbjT (DUF2867 family)
MKTALIAGASGLVGSALLNLLLMDEKYDKIKILVRKPLEVSHPKLEQIIYDYNKPENESFNADVVYCCLGTTIKKAGSQQAFRAVDYDYPLQIAEAAIKNGVKAFAVITAIGANSSSRIFYNRVKGEVENKLKDIPFEKLLIFRPSMLLGPRNEFRFGEAAGKMFMKIFGFLFPAKLKAVHATQVAASMIYYVDKASGGITVVESDAMQSFPVIDLN